MLEAEGDHDRRRHRGPGDLLAGADRHRPVQPRRHHADGRIRHDAGYVAAALAVEVRRMVAGHGRPPGRHGRRGSHLHPDLVNVVARAGHASRSTSATPTRPRCSEAERRLADVLRRAGRGRGRRPSTAPVLARFEPVEFDPRVIDLVEGTARAPRPLGAAHAVGRRPRRPDAGPGLPDRDGVRAQPSAASATTRPSTPIRPTWPPASTSCSTSCSTWPTDTSTAGRRRSGRDPDAARRRGADGAGPARPHPQGGGRAADRPAPPGRRGRLPSWSSSPSWRSPPSSPAGSSPTCDDAEDWYEQEMPGPETQPLFDEAARLGDRLLPRLRRAHPRRAPLQHAGPRRAGRARSSPATARSTSPATSDARARPPVPARSSATTSSRARTSFGVWRGLRRPRRDDDLQRPALARDLPRDGAPGRRADPLRLQHADPLRARPEPGPPRRASTTTLVHAVRRVPERHVGGRRGQGRRRGGRRLAGPVVHRRPERADRRPGADDRRRADHGRLRPRLVPALHAAPCSTSTATAAPSSTAGSPTQRGVDRPPPTTRRAP